MNQEYSIPTETERDWLNIADALRSDAFLEWVKTAKVRVDADIIDDVACACEEYGFEERAKPKENN